MPWVHMEPIPGHPTQADIDVTNLPDPVRFGVAGDFDGDGLAELVLAPDRGSGGANDLWVMKYSTATGRWEHLSPIPGNSLMADLDATTDPIPLTDILVGNFDRRQADELVLVPKGQPGLWVMRYDKDRRAWDHFSQDRNHPIRADVPLPWPVKFAVTGDFDGDGAWEIAVLPEQDGPVRVIKYKGGGTWYTLWEIPLDRLTAPVKFMTACRFDGARHWLVFGQEGPAPAGSVVLAIRRQGNTFLQVPLTMGEGRAVPRFAVAGSFDGRPREQLALNIAPGPGKGDEFWVQTCTEEPQNGGTFFYFRPLNDLVNHPLKAQIDCGGGKYGARFAVAGDFDGDGRDELAVAPDAPGAEANDFWVMRFTGTGWVHLSPQRIGPVEADLDVSPLSYRPRFAVAARFAAPDRASLAVAIGERSTRGNDLWVMHLADGPGPRVTLQGSLTLSALDPLVGLTHPLRTPVEMQLQFNPFRHRFTADSAPPLGGSTQLVPEKAWGMANTETGALTMDLGLKVVQRRQNGAPSITRTECRLTTGLIRGHHPTAGSPVDPLTGGFVLVGSGRLTGGTLDGTDYVLTLTGTLVPNPLP